VGSVKACVLRVQLVSAATCITHSHRVQKQGPKAGKKRSGTAKKTKTGEVERSKASTVEGERRGSAEAK